jgi:diguanylate cyclase (GGDEF)-like protein
MNPARTRPLVLAVDDDPAARLLQTAAFEDGGFDVVTAADGLAALAAFREHHPDCVVLDVVMPGLDGYEACREIRREPDGQRVPVLIQTSLDDLESIALAYAAGATDFTHKGIAPQLLLQRVRFLLRTGALQRDLIVSEARLAQAQRIASIGHWEMDTEGRTVAISPVALDLLQLTESEAQSFDALRRLVQRDELAQLDAAVALARTGQAPFGLDVHLAGAGVDGRCLHLEGQHLDRDNASAADTFVLTLQDLTRLRRAEERLRLLSYFDPITGLPNLTHLRDRLAQAIDEGRGQRIALCAVDIEQFHRYNESFGNEVGNQLLTQIGQRLGQTAVEWQARAARAGSQNSVLVARLGSDEFALMLPVHDDFKELAEVLQAIDGALRSPFVLSGRELEVTPTVGVTVFPDDSADAAGLIRLADIALHQAKATHRGGHRFYSAKLREQAHHRLTIEADLRQAAQRGEFAVWYQPRVSLATLCPVGCEALIRWHHPTRGLVGPAEWIPIAEECGLIVEICEWVLQQACRDAAGWHRDGIELQVGVNVSAIQFTRTDVPELARRALEQARLPAKLLGVEVTEGVLIDRPQPVRQALNALRQLGVQVSLDDFGTGYSSLSYLRQLPIDTLKIDRSFVASLDTDPGGVTIVKAILALARGLQLRVVAEGVESLTQFDFLARHDCDEIQGYLFARPMTEPNLRTWLTGWLATPWQQRRADARAEITVETRALSTGAQFARALARG